jgi:hypothetical protein
MIFVEVMLGDLLAAHLNSQGLQRFAVENLYERLLVTHDRVVKPYAKREDCWNSLS